MKTTKSSFVKRRVFSHLLLPTLVLAASTNIVSAQIAWESHSGTGTYATGQTGSWAYAGDTSEIVGATSILWSKSAYKWSAVRLDPKSTSGLTDTSLDSMLGTTDVTWNYTGAIDDIVGFASWTYGSGYEQGTVYKDSRSRTGLTWQKHDGTGPATSHEWKFTGSIDSIVGVASLSTHQVPSGSLVTPSMVTVYEDKTSSTGLSYESHYFPNDNTYVTSTAVTDPLRSTTGEWKYSGDINRIVGITALGLEYGDSLLTLYTPVPEPSSALLLGIGGLVFASKRRRK